MERKPFVMPVQPKPQHKEIPETELLIQSHHLRDTRQAMIKPYENVKHPQLNRLYGSLRVENSWQNSVDNFAKGGITTVAGQQVAAIVTLNMVLPEIRLIRWPGAVSMYLCLRSFGMAPSSSAFATLGSLDIYYQDTIGGQIIPLSAQLSSDEVVMPGMAVVIPTPITDPGITQVGNLLVTLSGGATAGTYVWQIGFSYCYLLPTNKPYDIQHIEELLDGHPGPTYPHS